MIYLLNYFQQKGKEGDSTPLAKSAPVRQVDPTAAVTSTSKFYITLFLNYALAFCVFLLKTNIFCSGFPQL